MMCGKEFDQNDSPLEVALDSVDEVVLKTLTKIPKPPYHPFHIHVNPFQVIEVGGTPEQFPVWRDTWVVHYEQPVRVRIQYRRFTGDSVVHCHLLDHEDQGMMLRFRIVKGQPAPFTCG